MLMNGVLPDFIVCGAQQSGTSYLYKCLSRHPQVAPARQKEVHYFDYNYHQSVAWYRSHFPTSPAKHSAARLRGRRWVTGEGSPYYLFYPRAPERIQALLPNVRLIVLLRNPVDRAYAHYRHEIKRGRESLSFAAAIEKEPERLAGEVQRITRDEYYTSPNHRFFSYVSRGIYVEQLQVWLKRFDSTQMLILNSADVLHNSARTLDRVHHFLGIAALNGRNAVRQQRQSHYPPMDGIVRYRLSAIFRPHNQRLYDLLGTDFGWDT